MSRRRFATIVGILALAPLLQAGVSGNSRESEQADERLLQSLGISTDTRGLVEFLRLRSLTEGDRKRLKELVRQLGSPSYKEREQAGRELIMRGPVALPFIKAAMKEAPLEMFRRAEQCIKKIQSIGPEHPAAAARLLAGRQATHAIAVLFNYLPFADDEWVREEVLTSLGRLTVRSGKVDPQLTAALKDSAPERRAVAVYILARRGGPEQRESIRRFLADPRPEVRQSARQGLAGIRLFRGLAETAAADEAFLKINNIGTDESALLEFLRKRTLSEDDQKNIRLLVGQLGAVSYNARAEASKKLIAWGTPALTYLQRAARDADLEISRRALLCIEEIKRGPGPALPASAIRLLARPADRSPSLAIGTLLAYVPFADDETIQEETMNTLCLLSLREVNIDPLVVSALKDPLPARRAAAAQVLGRVGTDSHCRAARKLLDDPVPLVRFRAAQGLLAAQDKAAVPPLIALLTENNQSLVWQVEEILHGLAEEQAPQGIADNTAQARQQAVKAWHQWWQGQADIDLARAAEGHFHRGLITICEFDSLNRRRAPVGQVFECGHDGKARWKITGLVGPMDAQVLPNGRVLIAENSSRRVTERDLTGAVKWSFDLLGNPITCQRLPNGNTFIATYNQVLEVTPARRIVYQHTPGPAFYIFSARKLTNHRIVCISAEGKILELDAKTGKQLRTVSSGTNGGWASVEALTNGRYLVATMANGQVRELDAAGNSHWNISFPGAFRATRLPNGNTLVASMTTRRVAEFDRSGQMRWEKTCDGRPWSVRFR